MKQSYKTLCFICINGNLLKNQSILKVPNISNNYQAYSQSVTFAESTSKHKYKSLKFYQTKLIQLQTP